MLIICKRKSHTTHHTCPSLPASLPPFSLSLSLFLSCVFRYPDSPFGWLPRSKFTDLLTMNWQKPKSQTTTVERGAAVERNREREKEGGRETAGSVRYWASVKKWRWYHDTDREVRKLHTIIKWAAARAARQVATVQLAILPQLLAQPSLALIAISALRLRQN